MRGVIVRSLIGAFLGVALVQALTLAGGASAVNGRAGKVLFVDRFGRANGPNGLVTNEYAYRNPGDHLAVRSSKWETTSGSLFVKSGVGWTGVPDGCRPDRYSRICNDSAVFRLRTRRMNFGDVRVSFRLWNRSLTTTPRTPARAIDGAHVWLRYQSEAQLYAVSFNRRDGSVVIKKKCPGGPSNGGTYYSLSKAIPDQPIPLGVWQRIGVAIRNNADGSVAISLSRDQAPLASATDAGIGCAPLRAAGAVGIRGDNDNFSIDDFTVTTLPA
jgi:hypothetical protein